MIKVPGLVALSAFLLFLGMILYFPAHFDSFGILLPMCVSMFPETGDYLPNGSLLPSPPWYISLHLFCNPLIGITTF